MDQERRVSIEPRNIYSRGHWIKLIVKATGGKPTECIIWKATVLNANKYGECWGHHRGLRPGHLFKGVVRKLGRAESFPVRERFDRRDLAQTTPGNVGGSAGIESVEKNGDTKHKTQNTEQRAKSKEQSRVSCA